jgi:putative protein kinase ArgK-like GTPase of G3E family
MAPGVGLPFLRRFWLGWEVTVWEERVSTTEAVEEEGICRVVEEINPVEEEEVATPIRQKRHITFSNKERTAEMENSS